MLNRLKLRTLTIISFLGFELAVVKLKASSHWLFLVIWRQSYQHLSASFSRETVSEESPALSMLASHGLLNRGVSQMVRLLVVRVRLYDQIVKHAI